MRDLRFRRVLHGILFCRGKPARNVALVVEERALLFVRLQLNLLPRKGRGYDVDGTEARDPDPERVGRFVRSVGRVRLVAGSRDRAGAGNSSSFCSGLCRPDAPAAATRTSSGHDTNPGCVPCTNFYAPARDASPDQGFQEKGQASRAEIRTVAEAAGLTRWCPGSGQSCCISRGIGCSQPCFKCCPGCRGHGGSTERATA